MTTYNHLLLIIILVLALRHVKCQYASRCLIANSQQYGRCMPVRSCKSVYEKFENIRQRGGSITDTEKSNLSKLFCGRFKNVVHVCCSETDIQLNVEGLDILQNTTCGMFSGNRITHGQPAPLFGFPWMALLKYNYIDDPFRCGGTLISDRYILTAAHCIKDKENDLKEVRLGEYQISTDIDCTNATRKNECSPLVEDIQIEEIIIHENYITNGTYNDIALIRLVRQVEFKRHIKPICLPIFDDLRSKEYDRYIVSGWGITEYGTPSDILMTAYVPIVERSKCENQLRPYNLSHPLNNSHICAGGRDHIDACRGDSGGPLGYRDFYKGKPRFIQFGIVSLGLRACGVVNVPGVYTNVSNYIQWITDNVKQSTRSYTHAQKVQQEYGSPCLVADSQQLGRCMPVKSCKSVHQVFENIRQRGGSITDNEKSNLSKLYCGRFKNVVHVCCSETDIQLNVEGLDILKNTTCGIFNGNRVAHGQPAPLFGFPWMALLKYNYKDDPFRCGGTLISDQYVLTAAHCIKGKEHDLKEVRLGEYQISTDIDCTNATRKNECSPLVEDIQIEKFIIHEKYISKGIYNDIALIRLVRQVEFKRHIKPICLPIFDDLRSKEYDRYIVSGWGRTENGTPSDILKTAYVPIVNRNECESQLRPYNLHHPLDLGHICAGGKDHIDTCRGDSGGPLGYRDFYKGKPRFIQFGIVSLGLRECGVVNVPGVYTNVSNYIQWITDNVKESTNTFTQRFQQEETCTTPALENGFCVPYKDCPFVNELVQNYGSTEGIPKYYLNYIFRSKCSRDNEPIRLCCKFKNNQRPPSPQATTYIPDVTQASVADPRLTEDLDYNRDYYLQFNTQGLNILNGLSCGGTGGDRVAGGNETDLAEYPWMALLRYDAPGDEFKCGGSLITNRYVLTATHCVNKPIYPVIGIRLGEHDLRTDPDCRRKGRKNVCNPVVEDIGVEKIITHPRYNERRRINDIALIKLDRTVEFKRHIKPVCLPITQASFVPNSDAFTIAGWGATENSTRSAVLLKAAVARQERSVCQNIFATHLVEINQKHICAGDLRTGRDTCRGDSGGPLVAFNTYTNVKRFIQYGIVASGGIACNLEQNYPGIYTNVLTYLPWITNNIVN